MSERERERERERGRERVRERERGREGERGREREPYALPVLSSEEPVVDLLQGGVGQARQVAVLMREPAHEGSHNPHQPVGQTNVK